MKNTLLDRLIRYIRTREVIKEIRKGGIVCDLGCDEGHFLMSIRKNISKGYGFDNKIKERKIDNLYFLNKDINKEINIKASYITMLAVLEHLDNPQKAINNSYNTLEKNGKLIITTPSPKAKKVLELLSKLKLIDSHEIEDHKKYFNKEEIYNLLANSRFKDIKIKKFELGLNLLAIAKK